MKNWIVLVLALVTVSCTYSPVYNGKKPYSGSAFMLKETPRHTIDYFIEGMTEQLVASNQYLTAKTPLAVTSFVDLQDMRETNWLGNTVAESFMFQMQQRGYTVVDYKATGAIKVTTEGDFAISRNWKDLAAEQPVDFVLTGTMVRQAAGVMVNARIIGMRSRVVIASAQGFLPAERIGSDLDTLNKVRMRNGVIIRDDAAIYADNNVILKP
ncbi:FlgO family outer membrane protein [Photobacterium sp. GSS17]|uniref:FlgO family outer membrane protein n=1 Tax=Photobacterium TaxID=657 RepID=UPI0023627A33|nr:FlgO family outer membrane protein [Photobacterium sp. GSS17]